MATIATTPLWVYVLSRPKVRFSDEPIAFWSYSEADITPRRMYLVIDVALQNDGAEESRIGGIRLTIRSFYPKTAFAVPLLSSLDDGLIAKNGGRFRRTAVFHMEDPGTYKHRPQSRQELKYFNESFDINGTLEIQPGQNKRLLWGSETISEDVDAEWVLWDDLREQLREAGIEEA